MTIQIKNKAIPSSPRSKNYPTGAIVSVSPGGGRGVTSNGGGSNVTILGKDDLRSATDLNVFSSLRTLAEILSIIVTKDDTETKLTDSNVLSSLRVSTELDTIKEKVKEAIESLKDLYLSKTAPDETQFLIKLLGGLTVDNVGGFFRRCDCIEENDNTKFARSEGCRDTRFKRISCCNFNGYNSKGLYLFRVFCQWFGRRRNEDIQSGHR